MDNVIIKRRCRPELFKTDLDRKIRSLYPGRMRIQIPIQTPIIGKENLHNPTLFFRFARKSNRMAGKLAAQPLSDFNCRYSFFRNINRS